MSRLGKLSLVLLLPALVYGAVKGVMYYNAKQTVDDIVRTASVFADVAYQGISTDIRGSVSVNGITVQPLGADEVLDIESVRLSSDDPMFFLRGGQWRPGENAPPESLAFQVSGIRLPLSGGLLDDFAAAGTDASGGQDPCMIGLTIDPALLQKVGFTELRADLDGHYRISETDNTLELGINMDIHDVESTQVAATLNDVDTESLAHGAMPNLSLGHFSVAVAVSPEFGRQAVKACAAGSDLTIEQWSARLADQVLHGFRLQGVALGNGLSNAVREFYRDWGEFKIVARPKQPLGMLSLVFLPPDQLADALGLTLTVNNQLITDTSFSWELPAGFGLAGMFGAEQPQSASKKAAPRRIIVRRDYETVAVRDIASYVDHRVQIKPHGQPMREGLLKRIADGEAEVEQTVHGGKYTVYVPLAQIESVEALVQRELPPRR